jgi:hypothetical protein
MTRLGAGLPFGAMTKASLSVAGELFGKSLTFKYNPTQISLSKSAEWQNHGMSWLDGWVPPTFTKTAPGRLTMEIFFDAFEELTGDVSGDVQTLINWTKPDVIAGEAVHRPPKLQFEWGMSRALKDVEFYLESVNATYTLFRMDGTPIRATCDIVLVESTNPANKQNPTSGGRPGLQAHVITQGETLHAVAWALYRDASYWRALADFNGIDDPLRVRPGTRLLIPPRADAAGLS